MAITFRVPAEVGPVVLAGLERIQAEIQAENDAAFAQKAADDVSAETPDMAAEPITASTSSTVVPDVSVETPGSQQPMPRYPLLGVPIDIFGTVPEEHAELLATWRAKCAQVRAHNTAVTARTAAAGGTSSAPTGDPISLARPFAPDPSSKSRRSCAPCIATSRTASPAKGAS